MLAVVLLSLHSNRTRIKNCYHGNQLFHQRWPTTNKLKPYDFKVRNVKMEFKNYTCHFFHFISRTAKWQIALFLISNAIWTKSFSVYKSWSSNVGCKVPKSCNGYSEEDALRPQKPLLKSCYTFWTCYDPILKICSYLLTVWLDRIYTNEDRPSCSHTASAAVGSWFQVK